MSEPAQALAPGVLIEGLQVQQVLGQDAAGITYAVVDPLIGTRFALREYLPRAQAHRTVEEGVHHRPGQEDAFHHGLGLFLSDARQLARLDHPGVVRVLRFFQAHGTAYMLMPLYHGSSLAERLDEQGPFEAGEAVRELMLPLLDTLEYLHSAGITHGALSPSGIFVQDGGAPVVMDLHAGKGRQAPSPYRAPEAADSEDAPRADLYGLAAILHRALTGQEPPTATERTRLTADGQPDPLASPESVAPGALGTVIHQGLALDPDARPRSAGEWRKAFESLDWRLKVTGRDVPADEPDIETQEDREWLPKLLLTLFALLIFAIAAYLFSGRGLPGPAPGGATDAGPAPAQPARTIASQEERRRWTAALEADTVLAYRRFLGDFPDSVYAAQARVQLDILDEAAWQRLSAENTRPAYLDYVEEFPTGLHQAEALRRIEAIDAEQARLEREREVRAQQDRMHFERAREEGTVDAMERYLARWPAGQFIEAAEKIRRQLLDRANDDQAFEAAIALDSRDGFQAYIDAFPRGAHVAAALQAVDRLTLRPGKAFRDCAACPEMMVLPAGTFAQGAANEDAGAPALAKPQRQVTIARPFAMARHEVTLDQYDACVDDAGACPERPGDNGWGRGRRPAILVSWDQVQHYLQWLRDASGEAYRLPSESEWEYAARAGASGEWAGGAPERVCEMANIAGAETDFRWRHEACDDGLALGTAPVGSYRANAFGLHDMTGNVAEWTADCLNLSYLDAPVDGSAWTRGLCSSHMTRGGSWLTGSRDIRLSARFNLRNGDRNDFTGFRVVRDIEPQDGT